MVFSILSCSFLKNMYHRNSALLRSRSPQLPVVVLDAFLPVPSPSSPSSAHSHAQLIGVFVCAVMCVACVVYRRYGGHKEKLKQARTGDEQRRNSPLKQRTGVQTFPFSRGMDCFSERRKMMTQRKPNMQAKKALFWGGTATCFGLEDSLGLQLPPREGGWRRVGVGFGGSIHLHSEDMVGALWIDNDL